LAAAVLVNPTEQSTAVAALTLYLAQSHHQAVAAEEETTILVQRKLVQLAALAAVVLLAGLARLPAGLATLLQQAPAKVIQVAQAHLQLGTVLAAAVALQQLAATALVQTVALVAQEQPLVSAAAA
jgi:hypothetical protein